MGGILANNASGMCCGVRHNAYHTLRTMTFVLPNGAVIDTADPGADNQLQQQAPALYEGMVELQRQLQERPDWQEVIRSRYRQKNTTGYSLNALLDFHRPVDVAAHLLIWMPLACGKWRRLCHTLGWNIGSTLALPRY